MRGCVLKKRILAFATLVTAHAGLAAEANAQMRDVGADARAQPNIVLIVVDDLGRAELGGYGQRTLHTPHLDALAARSALFQQAYSTAPVCAPSRCSIMTGLHAGHCAVEENFEPNMPLATRDVTVAELLESVGYHGVMIGKWALGGELDDGTPWDVQSAPWRVGFSRVFAGLDQSLAQDHFPSWLWRADDGEGVRVALPENDLGARATYAPDLFAEEAVRAVAHTEEPFFLYLAPTLPHRELVVPETLTATATLSLEEVTYAAMIERLDRHVGMVLEAIEERGIASRTLVVFTSDNGPNAIDGHALATFDSSGGLRGRKRDLYEGGIRVPLLIAGPNIEARAIDVPVSLADLLPTFTDLAGAPHGVVDGASMSQLLGDEGGPLHESLFFACRETGGGAEPPTRDAVRRGDWKWIRRADGVEELFDLALDPSESVDVAAQHPEIARALADIAAHELAPREDAHPPLLHVRIGDAQSAPRARPSQAVLQLRARDLSEAGTSWPQALSTPAITATLVDATPSEEGEEPCVRFARDHTSHVVIPAHPALALGGRSFSLRARFELDQLADGPTRDARQWLVQAKPMGTHDGFAAFGVLLQSGDLCVPTDEAPCNGREVALLFGDPALDEVRPFVVVTNTRIEDDRMHDLEVRVMREQGLIEVRLDDEVERIPVLFPTHAVESEAPWILGAHHAASGRFTQGLSGALFEFDVTVGADEARSVEETMESAHERTLVVDFGPQHAGATLERTLQLESPDPRAHWFRAEVRAEDSPSIQVDASAALLLAGSTHTRAFRWSPVGTGLVEDTMLVMATRGRTGELVRGAPLRIILRAQIEPVRASESSGLLPGLAVGTALATLVTALIASRKRR